jgi:hypothetical protein
MPPSATAGGVPPASAGAATVSIRHQGEHGGEDLPRTGNQVTGWMSKIFSLFSKPIDQLIPRPGVQIKRLRWS